MSCPTPTKAKVDDRSFDLNCTTSIPVKDLYLRGTGVKGLCSVYIGGGERLVFVSSDVDELGCKTCLGMS